MKKSLLIFGLAASIIACGPKQDKNNEETTVSATETPAEMDEASKAEARKLKRERLEKMRADKEKSRYDAYMETVKTTPTFKDESGEIVYNKAEVDPEFVGGKAAMEKWLSENLMYPQSAKDTEQEGTVFVDFVIGSNGKVRNVTAEPSDPEIDQSLTMEAMRAVSSMPTWKPGTQKGKAVPVKFSVPISFILQ